MFALICTEFCNVVAWLEKTVLTIVNPIYIYVVESAPFLVLGKQ